MQVRKRDTSRIYALKILRKAHIISRSEVNHTLAERTVLAQINNPFIVPLKFSFQSPEKLYLVLAFVNGGELFHHLQREGRFSEERSRFYAAELMCALECLHGFNVVYRYAVWSYVSYGFTIVSEGVDSTSVFFSAFNSTEISNQKISCWITQAILRSAISVCVSWA